MARLEINNAELNRLLHGRSGPVGLHVEKYGKAVARRAKTLAPKDRGNLRASIAMTASFSPSGLSLVVSARDHAAVVIHQGHKRINVPPMGTAPYMKFQPKDLRRSKKFIRTNTVRAVGGYPFLTAAMVDANKALPIGTQFRIVIRIQPRRGVQPTGLPRLQYPT